MKDYLKNLNSEQLLPVKDTEGEVLVFAGAGSGKTRVLTSRVIYLIDEMGVRPFNILAITFTNKAAKEMRERLENAIGERGNGMWVCTIHSMCVKILRAYGDEIGIIKGFSIYDETDKNNVIKRIIADDADKFKEKLKEVEKALRGFISEAKMRGVSPEASSSLILSRVQMEDFPDYYKKYQDYLNASNALDFDDLLLRTRELLRVKKDVRRMLAERFRYVHVDEFQDTNKVQYDIIKYLSCVHCNLFVVGDDDQSIYSWRGALVENILNFRQDFPNAKIYKLQQNYRSTKSILQLANASIKHNTVREYKELWTDLEEGDKPVYFEAYDERDEAARVVMEIQSLCRHDSTFSDFAILMRVNAASRSFEEELVKRGVPYKVFGGFKFYQRKEIKDFLCYLRAINNAYDRESLLRIINTPKRGIGDKAIEAIENYAEQNDVRLYDALAESDKLNLSAGNRARIREFYTMLSGMIIDSQDCALVDFMKRILRESGLYAMYMDGSNEGEDKCKNLDSLVASAEEFVANNGEVSLSEYLQQVALVSDTDDMDEADYVTVATIHSVKGLEFKNVFIVGLEDGIMPISRAANTTFELEEERRLMYVAITRAQKKLYLSRATSRFLYGERRPTMKSRFVVEISDELGINKQERRQEGASTGGGAKGFGGLGGGNNGGFYGGYSSIKSINSTEKSKPKEVGELKPGVKVKHPKFGVGMIITTSGEGNAKILNVAFDGMGIKQLSAALAPLEIIVK